MELTAHTAIVVMMATVSRYVNSWHMTEKWFLEQVATNYKSSAARIYIIIELMTRTSSNEIWIFMLFCYLYVVM